MPKTTSRIWPQVPWDEVSSSASHGVVGTASAAASAAGVVSAARAAGAEMRATPAVTVAAASFSFRAILRGKAVRWGDKRP